MCICNTLKRICIKKKPLNKQRWIRRKFDKSFKETKKSRQIKSPCIVSTTSRAFKPELLLNSALESTSWFTELYFSLVTASRYFLFTNSMFSYNLLQTILLLLPFLLCCFRHSSLSPLFSLPEIFFLHYYLQLPLVIAACNCNILLLNLILLLRISGESLLSSFSEVSSFPFPGTSLKGFLWYFSFHLYCTMNYQKIQGHNM